MKITSSAFGEGELIPVKYTGRGQDLSPPLAWTDVPEGAKSLAIITDDPDAPAGTWVHWVYYDIPVSVKNLSENTPKTVKPSPGGTQGINDFGRNGWGGPSPPSGTHRYFFKLYALDKILNRGPGATKKQLMADMQGHILAEASLMGIFKR